MDSDSSSGGRNLTVKYLQELFKKDWKLYYRTPELNEKLYLHYKGKCCGSLLSLSGMFL
jgi:hypothetical protein